MNNSNNLSTLNDAQCCIDYCKTTFSVAGKEVVNIYKCDQAPFSPQDLWQIEKNKRSFESRITIQ